MINKPLTEVFNLPYCSNSIFIIFSGIANFILIAFALISLPIILPWFYAFDNGLNIIPPHPLIFSSLIKIVLLLLPLIFYWYIIICCINKLISFKKQRRK